MNDVHDPLHAAWQTLVRPFPHEPSVRAAAFAELTAAYTHANRHYHNLDHIQHVLQVVDNLRNQASHLPALRLAVWFHDIVYDSRAKDNEDRSALHAGEWLAALQVPLELSQRVQQLILLTKTHHAPAADGDGHLLLDADLAILGANIADYARYAQAIRQEYAWVPEAEYRAGRTQVLRNFLHRERIFWTPQLFEQGEAQARKNLRAEMDALA